MASTEFVDETLTEGFHVLYKDPSPELLEIIEMVDILIIICF